MNTKKMLCIFIWLLRIMSIGIGFIFYNDDKLVIISAIIFVILSFFPLLFNKYSKTKINNLLFYLYTILILNATIIGKGLHLYEIFYWWDISVHLISGIVSFMFGLILCDNMEIKRYRTLFILCFACTLALSWEIFEFTGDTMFGTDNQEWSGRIYEPFSNFLQVGKRGHGLVDTMMDMIYAIVAYILTTITYFFYKKSRAKSTI